jgi:hypothetical protein
VLEGDLYYIVEVVTERDYYLIEDCKTLKEKFLKKSTMDRMRVQEVHIA